MILMLPQKCATTTIQARLKRIHDVPEYGKHEAYSEEVGRLLTKHVTLDQALQLKAFQGRSGYLKACFVRNPYDRVYSWFQWIVKTNESQIEKLSNPETPDPQGLKTSQLEIAMWTRNKLEKSQYDFNKFVRDNPKTFDPVSLYTHHDGQNHMDFTGRLEQFEEDFDQLCELIGYDAPNRRTVNVVSRSERTTQSGGESIDQFSSRTIRLVNKLHADDFRFYGYPKVQPKFLSL